MAEFHWFPMYARDWLGGEGTSMMLPEQEGAFIRLLCVAWADGASEPSLPTDAPALAQMSRLGARWKRLGALVLAQFNERGGRLYNPKLSAVWTEQQERSRRLAESGRKGGRAKAGLQPRSSSDASERVANPCQSESESESKDVVDDTAHPIVPPDPELTALFLNICANKAITERWGEQIHPLIPSGAESLTRELRESHIGAEVARLSIYRQCRDSKLISPPTSINYFLGGIKLDAERAETRATMAQSGERPPKAAPSRSGNGRGTRALNPGAQMVANILGGHGD